MRGLAILSTALLAGCSPALLTQVNDKVNSSMVFAEDAAQYGLTDKWVANCPAKGDCEDYALCKARKLLAAGVQPDKMSLVVVMHEKTPHAVLHADGWVLDNLANVPMPAERDMRPRVYGCRLDGRVLGYAPRLGLGGGWVEYKSPLPADKCEAALTSLAQNN